MHKIIPIININNFIIKIISLLVFLLKDLNI